MWTTTQVDRTSRWEIKYALEEGAQSCELTGLGARRVAPAKSRRYLTQLSESVSVQAQQDGDRCMMPGCQAAPGKEGRPSERRIHLAGTPEQHKDHEMHLMDVGSNVVTVGHMETWVSAS